MTVLYDSETSRLVIRDGILCFEKKTAQHNEVIEDLQNTESSQTSSNPEEVTTEWANIQQNIDNFEISSSINWGSFDYEKSYQDFLKKDRMISKMSSQFSYAGVGRKGNPRLYFSDKSFITHSNNTNITRKNCYACDEYNK